jgi:phosphoribosylanthranilate isomerase
VNVGKPLEVAEIARCAGVQMLQLHGDESADYCRELSDWTLIKAVRIGKNFVPESLKGHPAQAFLLDVRDDVLFGGTGRTFDWSLAEGIKKLGPVILAGGLHAGNVGEAIRTVRPYGVDVCSGVEIGPGRKDPAKLREFMREVRNVIRIS